LRKDAAGGRVHDGLLETSQSHFVNRRRFSADAIEIADERAKAA